MAQEIPAPEVEIDGSVYQHIDPSVGRNRNLMPVKLLPPPSIAVEDMDPQAPVPPLAEKTVQDIQAPVPASEPPPQDENPEKLLQAGAQPLPKPEIKPTAVAVAEEPKKPIVIVLKKKPAKIKAEEPKAETVAVVPMVPGPDLLAPPPALNFVEGIKAPVSKPVIFPVKTSSKVKGEFDPALEAAEPTPIAKAEPVPASKESEKVDSPAEAAAQPIYQDVPLPKPRPSVVMASREFVEKARRSYEDTYTIVKRDGDKMPVVASPKVKKEGLPPARLSVADIANDPLASQLVAMSPNDIAAALNNITPAAGRDSGETERHRIKELKAVSKPKIVRENGNWVPKTPESAIVASDGEAPILPPESSARAGHDFMASVRSPAASQNRLTIPFKSGETELPASAVGDIDKAILAALQNDDTVTLQILGYAGAPDGKEAEARRISLSRALSTRSYLIGKGIDATRLDVRAAGLPKDAKEEQDRVELVVVGKKS